MNKPFIFKRHKIFRSFLLWCIDAAIRFICTWDFVIKIFLSKYWIVSTRIYRVCKSYNLCRFSQRHPLWNKAGDSYKSHSYRKRCIFLRVVGRWHWYRASLQHHEDVTPFIAKVIYIATEEKKLRTILNNATIKPL